MPTPTAHGRPSSSIRRPVKKYRVTRPSTETKPASTVLAPVAKVRAAAALTRATSSPRKKSAGFRRAIASSS